MTGGGFMLSQGTSFRLSSWHVSVADGSILTESLSENVLFNSDLRPRQKYNKIR